MCPLKEGIEYRIAIEVDQIDSWATVETCRIKPKCHVTVI